MLLLLWLSTPSDHKYIDVEYVYILLLSKWPILDRNVFAFGHGFHKAIFIYRIRLIWNPARDSQCGPRAGGHEAYFMTIC